MQDEKNKNRRTEENEQQVLIHSDTGRSKNFNVEVGSNDGTTTQLEEVVKLIKKGNNS